MSTTLIIGVTLAYVGVCVSESLRGNYPYAIVFGGYALANIGMIMGLPK